MSPGTPTGLVARAPRLLLALAVLALPVTGLAGIDALGELKGSASVYLLLAALAFAFLDGPGAIEVPRLVLAFAAALVAWLVVDAAINYETIASVALQGRSGSAKLVTSSTVLVFGVAVAVLAGHLLRDARDLDALFLRPLTLSILACAAFAVPEVLTWAAPSASALYASTTGLFHTAESEQGRVVGRLTSIAFEAPDLSYFAALALPWLVLGLRQAWRARRGRAVAVAALIAGLALVALSNSRTGFLMLAALVVAEAASWLGLRRLRLPAAAVSAVLAAGLTAGVVLLATRLSGVGETAVAGEDVSTITRSALLTAQLAIFADHPLFGVGFGQYGFHVPDLLPPWAWTSYEIERYFETRGELPPAFNVFGRVGSELGLPGLVIWFGFWIAAIHRAARAAAVRPARSPELALDAALLASAVCLIVGGISTDAFRRPETRILVAVTGLYAGSGPRAAQGALSRGSGARLAFACLALVLAAPAALAQGARAPAPRCPGTLSVQFTDKLLRAPGWRRTLDRAAGLGARFVRVDLNWPWTETAPGRYAWAPYDAFAAELKRRGLRPLFILNRPNRVHGRPYRPDDDGRSEAGIAPPRGTAEVAAFARWAAAAALRFRDADPIWEIWNEPDGRGFWPPEPEPDEYVALARTACAAIKRAVPTAYVAGPAAAEMPTVWDADKPLVAAVMRDPALTRCLDAVSLHTHRFGQAPETVSRDYAVFRRVTAGLPGTALPLIDTEWGDSVSRGGLSEARQARWLPRMILANLLEGVALTNWYCLVDTGDDDGEREDRFGLVTRDGRPRPAYRAYQVLAGALRGYALRQVIARFDAGTARGATVLLFCEVGGNPDGRCKLAAWTTDESPGPARTRVPGWTLAGPITGHLGRALPRPPQDGAAATLDLTPDVQFVEVRQSRNGTD